MVRLLVGRASGAGERAMTGRDVQALREPGDPQRATAMELFFDLVFVFMFIQLSQVLTRRLDWSGAFQTLVLLLASRWVWSATTWITDRLNPLRAPVQVIVIGTIVGGLTMAAVLPQAFGDQGVIFAGTYVTIQIARDLFLLPTVRGSRRERTVWGALFWAGVSAVPWIAGAFTHGAARGALWSVAVAIDYTAFAGGFPAPKVGRTPRSEAPIGPQHLAERYRQFSSLPSASRSWSSEWPPVAAVLDRFGQPRS